MGRKITIKGEKLTLTLTGLNAFFAFKQKIVIPYQTIEHVFVGPFQAPEWMIRMPGTSYPPMDIYEGSYKYGDEWYFLSYGGSWPLLQIELKGHKKYRYVIVQIEQPTKKAAEIRK
ncbi:hypothetical protein R4Z10_17915 [Niallia sp. XMNu-256]|uniref:hypothetical protein n=1 Tax=Niallia sp. XMNu-256 TaxID=3082444 RepID=UPI0030D4F9AB